MSRPVERITPFLEKVKIKKVIDDVWKLPVDSSYVKHLFDKNVDVIKEFWLENPFLRFSQVLVNLGILPNIPGIWYYMEDSDILTALGYNPEDILLWGINYDKDMKLLPKTIYKPISELNSDHLRAIINGGFVNRNKQYRQLMCKVLRSRGERL